VLTLWSDGAQSLWEDALPLEVRELPEDLAALDRLLADPELLAPIVARWRWEVLHTGRAVITEGRPTIAMETYVRLMLLKQRYRWGIARWWRRSQTRFTCGASVGSVCASGCPTSRRSESSPGASGRRR
jgi:hypothetical protein